MLLATPWQWQDVNTTPPIPQQHGRDVCADTHQGPAASGGAQLPPPAAGSDFVSLRVQSRWQADRATGNFFNPQWFGLVEGCGASAWQTNFVRKSIGMLLSISGKGPPTQALPNVAST